MYFLQTLFFSIKSTEQGKKRDKLQHIHVVPAIVDHSVAKYRGSQAYTVPPSPLPHPCLSATLLDAVVTEKEEKQGGERWVAMSGKVILWENISRGKEESDEKGRGILLSVYHNGKLGGADLHRHIIT